MRIGSQLVCVGICLILFAGAAYSQPVYNPVNGHYYERVDVPAGITWPTAKAAAELTAVQMGGHLAAVDDAAENAWIWSTFGGPATSLWIGLHDNTPGRVWAWTTGQPVSYTNWAGGEPNNGTTLWNYGHMWCATPAGVWTDAFDLPDIRGPNGCSTEATIQYGVVELTDCNLNEIGDGLDISSGTSEDCNGNGVPDECDLASGTAQDCNGNGVPDTCETGGADCNSNAIPDLCELIPSSAPAKLTPADGAAQDWFGVAVALDGDTAIVGAPLDDDGGFNAGSVYILNRSGATWTVGPRLLASAPGSFAQFGRSVAIDGDVAVVGAIYATGAGINTGAAYVFRRTGGVWAQEQRLYANDGVALDGFGRQVAVRGDLIVVSAATHDQPTTDAGAVYVFRRTGGKWVQEQKLTAADAAAGDRLGEGLAIGAADMILAGSPFADAPGSDSGAVYAFRLTGGSWSQAQKLVAADGAAEDYFGFSLDADGTAAIIGSPRSDQGASNAGAAYVFRWDGSTWSQEGKLTGLDPAADDFLGRPVTIRGEVAFVGSANNDAGSADSGAAYLFHR